MKDYSSKFTEVRGFLNDMLKKNDDEFLKDFLNASDYSMFYLFCITMEGDIKRLRRHLRRTEILIVP